MVEEEFEEVRGPGEPPERHGAELVDVVVGPMGLGEDVGDSLDHGVDPGGVAGGDAGDDVAVAEFVGAGEFHVPLPPFGLFAGGVGFGVGLDDRGLRDLQHTGRGMPADHLGNGRIHHDDLVEREVAGEHGCFAGDPHLTATGLDDLPGLREPVLQVEHIGDQGPGGGVGVLRAIPSSGRAYSRTSGVPSPPGVTIGSARPPTLARGVLCIPAHPAASSSSATSASRRTRIASAAASRSSRGVMPSHDEAGAAPAAGCPPSWVSRVGVVVMDRVYRTIARYPGRSASEFRSFCTSVSAKLSTD